MTAQVVTTARDPEAQAEHEAALIREYWRRHGANPEIKIEPRSVRYGRENSIAVIYTVRSDMLNGLPRER